MEPTPLLSVRNLSKTFPGVLALDQVSLDVHAGEIVAVVGQNGSGKSTLVKVLAGVYEPDPGAHIEVRDGAGNYLTGQRAMSDLHFIHQDLGLVPELSTIENIDIGRPLRHRGLTPYPRRAEVREFSAQVAEFGGHFDVTVPVHRLTAAERTIVAIARAMDGWERPDHVLVLDEPTAALHSDEVKLLFDAVRIVAARGGAVVFISHRLDEVTSLADRVVALRDGRVVGDTPAHAVDNTGLAELIVGRRMEETRREPGPIGKTVLSVQGLSGATLDQLSLELRAGEVVGVSGLLGSGREHLCGLVFGAIPRTRGVVHVAAGAPVPPDPRASIAAGMAYVPADRHRSGVILPMNVRENLTLPALRPLRRWWGGLHAKREGAETAHWVDRIQLRPALPERAVAAFSGGNQQKVALAKWLRAGPRVLLLDEPTQGVDIGARAALYDIVGQSVAAGCAVLICSSDDKELVAFCDRVLVLRDGRVVDELSGDELTPQALLEATVAPSGAATTPSTRHRNGTAHVH
ncbi:sugar ABC transporter ATP-binding protein [Pimelobacter simplex]|uniref:sugar ABC transporter ATP-binding protein n=1 Tax=Nocardioides simplex TaxID=2045 RepID=UPI0019311E0B|nr:sugar ABC transporter ATP-binding protein [Pimelobacter simplex]